MSSSGVRPRYGRIVALAAATTTTLVATVGTVMAGPADDPERSTGARPEVSLAAASAAMATAPSTGLRASLSVGLPARGTTPSPTQTPTPTADTDADTDADADTDTDTDVGTQQPPPPPQDSGTGRRVVFSESEQRVWLLDRRDRVVRTYLVSGSIYDNLDPGSYEVYSRSATATGIDGSQLRWMVRFTQGDNAAIGFHWIPRLNGERMQTRAELGTPLSHGCIRQATPDAKALWAFAPVGTPVVVTA